MCAIYSHQYIFFTVKPGTGVIEWSSELLLSPGYPKRAPRRKVLHSLRPRIGISAGEHEEIAARRGQNYMVLVRCAPRSSQSGVFELATLQVNLEITELIHSTKKLVTSEEARSTEKQYYEIILAGRRRYATSPFTFK